MLMKTPVELPSGQILDLDRCIALRLNNTDNYELILAGYPHSIEISAPDALQLKQLLKSSLRTGVLTIRTEAEQLQRNLLAAEKLRAIIDRDRQQQPSIEAAEFFEEFKQIMDEHRPVGSKLYSE
jgi:hypothetical protein